MNNHKSVKRVSKTLLVIGSAIALGIGFIPGSAQAVEATISMGCLLYTSDAADE